MTYNGTLRKINKFLLENVFYLLDISKLKAIILDLCENDSAIIRDLKYIFDAKIINKILDKSISPFDIKTITYDVFYNKYNYREELSKRLAHFVSSLVDVNVINVYNNFLVHGDTDNLMKIDSNFDNLTKNNVGDEVVFGKYNNELLKWIVLDKRDKNLYLCLKNSLNFDNESNYIEDSIKNVDIVMFRDKYSNASSYVWHKWISNNKLMLHKAVNWENSGYRKVLNFKFYNEAFSDCEKKMLQLYKTDNKCVDLVFLLKIEEIYKNYYLLANRIGDFYSIIYQENKIRKHKYATTENGNLYIHKFNYWDFKYFNPCIVIKIDDKNDYASQKPLTMITIGKETKRNTKEAILEHNGFYLIDKNDNKIHYDAKLISKSDSNSDNPQRVLEQNKKINYLHNHYNEIIKKKKDNKNLKSILKPFGKYRDIDLEWELYYAENNNGLFVLKHCLTNSYIDSRYNVNSWEDTFIHNWLNDGFYNNAFDKNEKNRIIIYDSKIIKNGNNKNYNIFLLSDLELQFCRDLNIIISRQYKFDSKSRYSCYRGKFVSTYWLRTINQNQGYYVDRHGRVKIDYITNIHGIRPAMWVKLN